MEELGFRISQVRKEDVAILCDISRKTFYETFAPFNTEENIQAYLNANLSVTKLLTEINTAGSLFYFIFKNQVLVGYLKLNSGNAQSEPNTNALEIERIYVLKDYHHQRAGLRLFEKAKSIGLKNQNDYIWLGVWEKNTEAIAFYKKLGFTQFDKHIFILGNDPQTDLMMKYNLK
ncbi:MAG: family N-acetyltransferase [Bacteroidota bacterium]|jgi:ribosomal protein S18 acetylase RimI-like enzyme|nr:family N-acetyltransferase [Bacteroidota bacterium]